MQYDSKYDECFYENEHIIFRIGTYTGKCTGYNGLALKGCLSCPYFYKNTEDKNATTY